MAWRNKQITCSFLVQVLSLALLSRTVLQAGESQLYRTRNTLTSIGVSYDRYWMGRSSWSDIIRNARGISRIIWFHVPPRVSPRTPEEIATGTTKRSKEEMQKIMDEKRMALDLVEGYAIILISTWFDCLLLGSIRLVVAVKHHLRGGYFARL